MYTFVRTGFQSYFYRPSRQTLSINTTHICVIDWRTNRRQSCTKNFANLRFTDYRSSEYSSRVVFGNERYHRGINTLNSQVRLSVRNSVSPRNDSSRLHASAISESRAAAKVATDKVNNSATGRRRNWTYIHSARVRAWPRRSKMFIPRQWQRQTQGPPSVMLPLKTVIVEWFARRPQRARAHARSDTDALWRPEAANSGRPPLMTSWGWLQDRQSGAVRDLAPIRRRWAGSWQ